MNLTPFIDLLSTIVCFLLIVAVWVQVGSVEIKQSYGTAAPKSRRETYELALKFQGPNSSLVDVKRSGRRVKRIRARGQDFSEMKGKLENALEVFMTREKRKNVDVSSLMVSTLPSVEYGDLVSVLDVFREHAITNIGIVPVPVSRGMLK